MIAIAGPSWWHTSTVGHYVNSTHLWSTELFFFFMVVHLWGKFFMAAWRGRAALTWITGAIAFLVSIGTAFTGYLSQQNFDSQWIGGQAKDGLNAAGIGSFFNVLNFGQMLLWHVVLLPLFVGILIAGHVLLVRRRGVVPPLPVEGHRAMSAAEYPLAPDPGVEWQGAKRRYDIVKEGVIALVAVTLLTLLLALVFSSPDDKPVTIAQWASVAPKDFVSTAVSELDGTSGIATYGPPYTHVAGAGQNLIGGFSIQRLLGVQIPIDPARAFVLGPLSIPAQTDPTLARAIRRWNRAAPATRTAWATRYAKALGRGSVTGTAGYGPVPTLMANLLVMARSGGLDGALNQSSQFYETNFTKALLFLTDGSYLEARAAQQNLLGSQWGMMNETGNFPGQAWLWLYTFWYQVPPFTTSQADNADAQIWGVMGILSLLFILLPFIPGVRSIPKWIPIYKLIWRDYYRTARQANAPPAAP